MNKKVIDALRADYVEKIKAFLADNGEEVLVTGSNEIAIPVTDSEGEDQYVVFTIRVPSGTRDGDIYDGYGEAESYAMKVRQQKEKAAAAAEAKARKIAKDKATRAAKAEIKARQNLTKI